MHKCIASGVKLNVFSMHQGMLLLTGKEEEVRPLTHKWVTLTMHSPSQQSPLNSIFLMSLEKDPADLASF